MQTIELIENQSNQIEMLKSKILKPVKLKLHTGIEGYQSPRAYGIYSKSGGLCLGVVGENFYPMDLEQFLDSIVYSLISSGIDFDISKLDYSEFKNGAKVNFNIPLKRHEVKSKMIGDIIDSKLVFKTGFDGQTRCSLSYMTYRLWCKNGAARWQSDYAISFKNTKNNNYKVMSFVDSIIKISNEVDSYIEVLNRLNELNVNDEYINNYINSVFGFNPKEYNDMTKKRQAVMDKINESILIEMNNTGANKFSLLQGVTRFLSHNYNSDNLIYGVANKLNSLAHTLILS
jgi:hypothetical protein